MNAAFEQFEAFCSLIGLLVFLKFVWRPYCIDRHRQALFRLRDELFDAVALKKVNLDFSSPAYTEFRRVLNNNIRFAHDMNFLSVAMTGIFLWRAGLKSADLQSPVDIAIEKVDDEATIKFLKRLKFRSGILALLHFTLTSPLFWIVIVASVACGIGLLLIETIKRVSKAEGLVALGLILWGIVRAKLSKRADLSWATINCQAEGYSSATLQPAQ